MSDAVDPRADTGAPHDPIARAERWTQVRVRVPPQARELAGEEILHPPFTGVACEGDDLVTYCLRMQDAPALRDALRARLVDLGARSGLFSADELLLTFHDAGGQDWERVWRESLKAFRVGRLALVPRHFRGTLRAGDVRFVLEPGGSYGTGRHPTTRFVLRALQRVLRSGDRVLDAGSGSGILAVAAALLGAAKCLGFDPDPNAVPSGRALAADNAIPGRCAFRHGDFSCLRPEDSGFDVVVANLHADILQDHAGALARLTRPGGHLLASGIRVAEHERTAQAFQDAGFEICGARLGAKWTALECRRNEGGARGLESGAH